ncbi:phage holin family protein [Candidatus Fukatsuia symbiotica]|uniref:phage holin family protein n=1 Tax=Candidatus Fukatsuia TaxID=1927833 RepID=UPI000933CF17|nr:phage holin family protein [Candidatus Fukatsuia symbiotica]MEA9445274.1 phage holin family protein [Candidatus Fukatsuia symbiotica]
MLSKYVIIVNAIACLVTAGRLFSYQRQGAAYRPWAGFYAYILIVASGSVTIRVLMGDYTTADWSETLINITVCIAVVAARGNIMRLARPAKDNL